MQKKNNFLEIIDQFFVVHGEKIEQKGEDSFLISVNERAGLAGVFDGCGGSGAKIYKMFGEKTGAFIASRVLSEVTGSWFDSSWDEKEQIYRISGATLKNAIDARLAGLKQKSGTGTMLKGSMTKEFPSTLAAAIVQPGGKGLLADFLCSGDSRVYVLDEQGLKQVSVDDLPVTDAMENLRQDAGMNNVVSASHPYQINVRKLKLDQPCIIFAATDGCFGYLRTPMEFEKLLLSTLLSSESIVQWQNALDEQFRNIAGDDYTMSLMSVGYGSFRKLKESCEKRYRYMERVYPLLPDTSEQELFRQWAVYRPDYEIYQKRDET